ncbi:MAG: hypothetical protein JWN96_1245 [Mycobacterium sp.]|jgi:bacterioferritin-associated ferredoxin|nr:hypothetical protein [Mycobacterium sp.]
MDLVDIDPGKQWAVVGSASFDAETWGRIQSELAQRSQSGRQRRHSTNPLLGVAKCGKCGRNMRHFLRRKNSKTYRYYICGDSPKACPGILVIAAHAEEMVYEAFLRAFAPSETPGDAGRRPYPVRRSTPAVPGGIGAAEGLNLQAGR